MIGWGILFMCGKVAKSCESLPTVLRLESLITEKRLNELLEHSYLEQYYRLRRWYKRLEKIRNKLSKVHMGNVVRLNVDDLEDEFIAFFIYCYHLKDWIQRDSSSRLRGRVENYINANEYLRICADICNRSKHFVLTRPREKWTPKFHFF